MTSGVSSTYIPKGNALQGELQEGGRVLLIRGALYNQATRQWHDIKLEHSKSYFSFLGFGGKFQNSDAANAPAIQRAYDAAIRTLGVAPSDVIFKGTATSTKIHEEKGATEKYAKSPRKITWEKTSHPFSKNQGRGEKLLSAEDAAKFGVLHMTVHDALSAGVYGPLGLKGASLLSRAINGIAAKKQPPEPTRMLQGSATAPAGEAPKQAGAASAPHNPPVLDENGLVPQPPSPPKPASSDETFTPVAVLDEAGVDAAARQVSAIAQSTLTAPSPVAQSTLTESGFDKAPASERQRRVVAHLDKSAPHPFSAFVYGNTAGKVDALWLDRMKEALRRLAVNPKASDEDAIEMRRLLEAWFKAGHSYLKKHSNPGDPYGQILARELGSARNDQERAEAEERAKDIYWREWSGLIWMTMISLFRDEKIDITELNKSINSVSL